MRGDVAPELAVRESAGHGRRSGTMISFSRCRRCEFLEDGSKGKGATFILKDEAEVQYGEPIS